MSFFDAIRQADRDIDRAQARISEQKAGLQRLIVQGFPTQSATDALSRMPADLRLMTQRKLVMRE